MPISLAHHQSVLTRYRDRWPEESEVIARLLESEFPACLDRRTMPGHFTASASVLDDENRLLLVHHKNLDKWLQPGGHIERVDETYVAAARREVSEETGIRIADLELVDDVPILVNLHGIPANKGKGEGAHLHFDIQYLLRAKRTELAPDKDEVHAAKWCRRIDHPREEVVKRLDYYC